VPINQIKLYKKLLSSELPAWPFALSLTPPQLPRITLPIKISTIFTTKVHTLQNRFQGLSFLFSPVLIASKAFSFTGLGKVVTYWVIFKLLSMVSGLNDAKFS